MTKKDKVANTNTKAKSKSNGLILKLPTVNNLSKTELIKLLNIEEVIKKPVRSLSLGQRMRCEIAASLIHEPKILFLDEPTIGLDIVAKEKIRDFISLINKERGVTDVLFNVNCTV